MEEQAAIDLILERGVRFRLTAPRWLQWLGLNTVTIKPPKVGTVLLIAGEMLKYQLGDLELLLTEKPTPRQIEGVARVVAVAILQRRATNEGRLKKLTHRLERDVTWASLMELYAIVAQMLRIEDFRSTTASIVAKAIGMVRGRKKEKGSQEARSKASIAPSGHSGKSKLSED